MSSTCTILLVEDNQPELGYRPKNWPRIFADQQ